jgi:DNA-binding transcriptional MerR regulator
MQALKNKTPQVSRIGRRNKGNLDALPTIPDKRYFTIGEVGDLCCVKPHVLRYWEEEFSQLSPVKRRGNRRYYQYNDVMIVRQIRSLLYAEGFTIEGARGQLASSTTNKKETVASIEQTDSVVKKLIADLEGVLEQLK